MVPLTDSHHRPLRDLRISVTDRCNFRCVYCMPADRFGPGHAFLSRDSLLSFEEIHRLAQMAVRSGVKKLRLTGGEPLLRAGVEDLVALLASIRSDLDLALTTNGVLLPHHAERLALAGLKRVTVSLDALDKKVFGKMNGTGADVSRVLAGISAAQTYGLPVKVNAVIRRGWNESEVLPLVRWARTTGVTLRFIEYMDVGETNGWRRDEVVTAAELLEQIGREFPLISAPSEAAGSTALRFRHRDDGGEIGIVASVTRPFCGACNRLRLSADGRLFTCLFAKDGHDLRNLLRGGAADDILEKFLAGLWGGRVDRYSEIRGAPAVGSGKAEMSYLGG